MPIAKVYVPENTLSQEQRQEIVQGIHEVINSVEQRPPGSPTYVQIHEIPARDWGFTGAIPEPGSKK